MAKTFRIGDVVQLNSGGPPMTVRSYITDSDLICEWFSDNNTRQEKAFNQEVLKSYQPPKIRISSV